jgi:hypothetical protein
MNNVIKYTAVSASNDVEDRYDGDVFDNFTGLDTDGDGINAEFSEASGLFKKVGGVFKKGGIKDSISNRREGLDDRLADREESIRGRQNRSSKRQLSRETRKNLRQVALVENNTPQVQQNIEKIVTANATNAPQLKESVNKTAEGVADQAQETQTQVVVAEANKMAANGNTTPPIIELDLTGNVTQVKDTWWKKQSKGVKVAIIGGSIVALGLTIWGITKIAKK